MCKLRISARWCIENALLVMVVMTSRTILLKVVDVEKSRYKVGDLCKLAGHVVKWKEENLDFYRFVVENEEKFI